MTTLKDRGVRVTSKAFSLWKDKEKREDRKITIDALSEETGLAKMTVRRYITPSGDVSGSPVHAAAIMAAYFGVGLGELLAVDASANAETAVAA